MGNTIRDRVRRAIAQPDCTRQYRRIGNRLLEDVDSAGVGSQDAGPSLRVGNDVADELMNGYLSTVKAIASRFFHGMAKQDEALAKIKKLFKSFTDACSDDGAFADHVADPSERVTESRIPTGDDFARSISEGRDRSFAVPTGEEFARSIRGGYSGDAAAFARSLHG